MTQYQPLEPNTAADLGITDLGVGADAFSFSTGQAVSFLSSVSLIWTLGIMACVGGAVFVIIRGGISRMEASEAGIRKSNEEWKRASLGLLGVMILWLIIYTVNRGLLVGDIDLTKLSSAGGVGTITAVTGTTGSQQSSQPSVSCVSPASVIQAVSSGNVCGNVSCTALSGCNYQQYVSIINTQAQAQGIDPKIAIVLMCKESKGVATANNKNPDGTYDCGLMQVNQPGPCDQTSLDPTTNITRGVALIKQKSQTSSVNRVYPGVPVQAGLFASYNCCSNGTIPNEPSVDCNNSTGFSSPIPKWACPINPGAGQFNMCNVKAYACDLTACLNRL